MRRAAPPPALRRLAASQTGTAAVEFALLGSLLIGVGVAMLDLGYAYYVRMRLSNAVTAAALYAQTNGRSLAATEVSGFLESVRSVAVEAADLFQEPTVTVRYNDRPDGGAFDNFYCPSDLTAPWTSVGTVATACGGNVQAGKFVTVSIVARRPTLVARPSVFGLIAQTSDFAVARVR